MAAFYQLRTPADTVLAVDLPTRWMFHAAPADIQPQQRPLLMIRPAARPNLAILVTDDADPELIFPPQGHLRTMLVFDIMLHGRTGDLALVHPFTHLSVLPEQGLDGRGQGGIGQALPTQGGCLTPEPIALAQVHSELRHRADALERVFEQQTLPQGLLDCVCFEPPAVSRHILRAMLHTLTVADFGLFADRVLNDAQLRKRLVKAVPDDIWITEGLPGLARLLASRPALEQAERVPSPNTAPPTVVPVSLDHLAVDGLHGRSVSFGHSCNLHARAAVAPVRKIGVVATARNEGLNLIEWVAYHRCVGVDDITIYSNNNSDGSEHLLKALHRARVITYIENKVGSGSPQLKAYGHALSLRAKTLDCRWTAIIDLDEFIVFNPDLFRSLPHFLDWHETREVDAIALNWVMMGSDGGGRRADRPVTQRFDRMLDGPNAHIKSILRSNRFVQSGAHFPHIHEQRVFSFNDASGRPHRYDQDTGWDDAPAISARPEMAYAAVFHYFYKSADEYIWKFARQRGDATPVQDLTYKDMSPHFIRAFVGQSRNVHGFSTDWAMRCAPDLALEMTRLMDLPGVAAAQRTVHERYEQRIVELRRLFALSDAVAQAGSDGAEMIQMLGADP